MQIRALTFALLLPIALLACSDLGDPLIPSEISLSITSLVPSRTVSGDSLRVRGRGFGDVPGDRSVVFSGAASPASVLNWGDEEIIVRVPADAATGALKLREGGQSLAEAGFELAPLVVSYVSDVAPLLVQKGCTQESCHGGGTVSQGLRVESRAGILSGSNGGAVVVSRQSDASLLVLKLRPNPPRGQRMPLLGSFLSTSEITTVADWVDQGLRDN